MTTALPLIGPAGLRRDRPRFCGSLSSTHQGAHYNYYRDFDPAIGRYIQPDPIGVAGLIARGDAADAKSALGTVDTVPEEADDANASLIALASELMMPIVPGAFRADLYSYADQNPLAKIDPLGLEACFSLGRGDCYKRCRTIFRIGRGGCFLLRDPRLIGACKVAIHLWYAGCLDRCNSGRSR